MSDKLYFAPVIGYKLTHYGVRPAYDNWNNEWQGLHVACANRDRNVPLVRTAPEIMSPSEIATLDRAFNPLRNPESVLNIPANTVRFFTTGTFDLGTLESPLKTICDDRQRATAEGQAK
jgi:hypothetical protein